MYKNLSLSRFEMGVVRCVGCGSYDIVMGSNGYGECPHCGLKYSPDAIKKQIDNYNLNNNININNHIDSFSAQNVFIAQQKDFDIRGGTLVKYNGENRNVVIPINVVAIGNDAFAGTYIISIVLPPGIKNIELRAFYGCKALTEINLPIGIEEIGSMAFANTGIKNFTIPSSIKKIGDRVFSDCCIDNLWINTPAPLNLKYLLNGATRINNVFWGEGTHPIISSDYYSGKIENIYFPQSIDKACILNSYDSIKKHVKNLFIGGTAISDPTELSAPIESCDYKIEVNEYSLHQKTRVADGYSFLGERKFKNVTHHSFNYDILIYVNGVLYKQYNIKNIQGITSSDRIRNILTHISSDIKSKFHLEEELKKYIK